MSGAIPPSPHVSLWHEHVQCAVWEHQKRQVLNLNFTLRAQISEIISCSCLHTDLPITEGTKRRIILYNIMTEVFLNLTEVFLTLTEVFPCFFLSCKANARVKLAKTGYDPHSSTLVCICVVRLLLFVLFGCYLCCSMYCLCVNVYCHRVTTQLQLINISYHSHSITINP